VEEKLGTRYCMTTVTGWLGLQFQTLFNALLRSMSVPWNTNFLPPKSITSSCCGNYASLKLKVNAGMRRPSKHRPIISLLGLCGRGLDIRPPTCKATPWYYAKMYDKNVAGKSFHFVKMVGN